MSEKLPYAIDDSILQRVSEQLQDDAAAKGTTYQQEVESFLAALKICLGKSQ